MANLAMESNSRQQKTDRELPNERPNYDPIITYKTHGAMRAQTAKHISKNFRNLAQKVHPSHSNKRLFHNCKSPLNRTPKNLTAYLVYATDIAPPISGVIESEPT